MWYRYDYERAIREKLEKEDRENATMSVLISKCKNMNDCERLLPGFKFYAHANELRCENCFRFGKDSPAFKGGGSGQKDGEYRDAIPGCIKGTTGRRGMNEVRKGLVQHCINSTMHDWCKLRAIEVARQDKEHLNVGLNLGKIILSLVKEHDSDNSFERRLATLSTMGMAVGTKNHSRMFVPRVRSSMAKVLYKGFAKLLSEPDPATKRWRALCLMADKATLRRRTGQMHGIIVMIDGVLVPILLSILLALDSTGEGLAKLLIEVLTGGKPLNLLPDQLRKSLTGLAFDGQYQGAHEGHASGLQVGSHLCEMLKLNPQWLISRWDGAHRIELGMDDVRKAIQFYFELASIISKTHEDGKYLYGKAYERVRAAAAELFQRGLAAISSVCSSRFCASEQRVYKNFYLNYTVFVQDMIDQRGVRTEPPADELKLRSVSFVTSLVGVIDLLRPVKNLSLVLQFVNQLPWELEDERKSFLDLMEQIAADLKAGKFHSSLPLPKPSILQRCDRPSLSSYTLQGKLDRTISVKGNNELVLKYLAKHAEELKHGQFSSPDSKDGTQKITIDLVKSSAQRSMRSYMGQASDSPETDFNNMLKELARMAEKIVEIQTERLKPPDEEYRYLRHMGHCLDLRKMAFDDNYSTSNQAASSLKVLYDWMATRDQGGGRGASAGAAADADPLNDLPSFEVLKAQWSMLISRLRMFRGDLAYSHWKDASGTVIMKDIFTQERFYLDVDGFLYLFQHMATKSMCEAVIEGMGGMWDRCATDGRHPSFETGQEEAVIAWSAPQPYHPAAVDFIRHTFNDVFGFDKHGVPKPWNLTHVDHAESHHIGRALGKSKVINRHKRDDKPRLPMLLYDVSTH